MLRDVEAVKDYLSKNDILNIDRGVVTDMNTGEFNAMEISIPTSIDRSTITSLKNQLVKRFDKVIINIDIITHNRYLMIVYLDSIINIRKLKIEKITANLFVQ